MELFANIERWAREQPGRPAHVGVDAHGETRETLTYRDLLARAERLAAHLRVELPPDHSPVVVLGHKEPEMLVGFLGAVGSGHPYIPLDDSLPAARVEAVVASAGARLTLTPARIAEICARPPGNADVPRLFPPGLDDPFYIIFTSGSTGQPKGVQITAGCLQAFLDWLCGEQRFREGQETFLNQAPFSFDLSVMDLYGSLATGGTLYSITRGEIANFKALFQASERFQRHGLGLDAVLRAGVSAGEDLRVGAAAGRAQIPVLRGNPPSGHGPASPRPFPRRGGLEHLRPHGGHRGRHQRAVLTRRCWNATDRCPWVIPCHPATIEIHDERRQRATRGRARRNHHRRSQRQSRIHRAA